MSHLKAFISFPSSLVFSFSYSMYYVYYMRRHCGKYIRDLNIITLVSMANNLHFVSARPKGYFLNLSLDDTSIWKYWLLLLQDPLLQSQDHYRRQAADFPCSRPQPRCPAWWDHCSRCQAEPQTKAADDERHISFESYYGSNARIIDSFNSASGRRTH